MEMGVLNYARGTLGQISETSSCSHNRQPLKSFPPGDKQQPPQVSHLPWQEQVVSLPASAASSGV